MEMATFKESRISRWYFGGIASAGAACCTHPLDLLKVQMQTQKGKNITVLKVAKNVVRQQGIIGLYNGISASVLRQLTYSMARFGVYDVGKQYLAKDSKQLPFHMSALLAALGGAGGGFVGNPADLVNVRMQNDIKLPPDQRRNYKNAVHGIYRVMKTEGITQLWAGTSMTCSRAVLMTIGQLSFYDLTKSFLLTTPYFHDNIITHFAASLTAGAIATTMCQPFDVLKTRAMNAKRGETGGIVKLIVSTAKEGPMAFFKGYVPAFVRLAPQTVLTFVFLEQLRLNFGIVKRETL
ncbi:mitochondrial dicarboxylate carrier-like isoform X2 [Pectinophora gossypiella]|uniref:mitochondrial dicarboxylate carrier-like isoform X2 n=1 Tax=Pectinophora gossypiella TaxID=13191 RepID=UPI00214E0D1A|nr:mitochondrial dicarboxylate carrier-like isoform X2 [Pectinophora gossypiella]